MKRRFSAEEKMNIQENLHYFLNQITTFKPSKYEWGDYGIKLSRDTFLGAYYATGNKPDPTERTMNIIARALSGYLEGDQLMQVDDLVKDKEVFIKQYSLKIKRNQVNTLIRFDLFENRLFRCYYLLPGSNKQALIGYFKIFSSNDGSISAYLLRGIKYFDDGGEINCDHNSRINDLKRMIRGFASPKRIKTEYTYFKENHKAKDDERIYLYSAEKENIHISKSCIKIDFDIVDESIGYKSTMFWNIEPMTKTIGINTVIGGLAFIVDTNDGDRQMCAYKMGLDAVGAKINNKNNEPYFTDKPLYCESPEILKELSISSDKNVYVLDRVEDTLWYYFIQDETQREISVKMYTEKEFHEVVDSFSQMKKDYDRQIEELKDLVTRLKNT